jgi:hypothetical protein
MGGRCLPFLSDDGRLLIVLGARVNKGARPQERGKREAFETLHCHEMVVRLDD